MSPALLHDLLDDAADRWPGAPAFTETFTAAAPVALTYRELAAASQALAGWLHGLGLRRGDRIVIAVAGHRYGPALLYAAARTGVVFCVVHEQVRGAVIEHVLTDCEPALVLACAGEWSDAAAARGVPVQTPDRLTAAVAAGGSGWDGPRPLQVDPACLIYTSGSTAMPKAVVSTHQQMVFSATAIQSQLGYRTSDVVFTALPMSFDYGLYQLFIAALGGAHVWWVPAADAGPGLLGGLTRSGATIFPAVPGLAHTLTRLLRRRPGGAPALRLMTNTGAVMPAAVLADLRACLPHLRVQLMYGLTECKRVTIAPPDADLERPGTAGRALPGTELLVVGPDGTPLPPGEIGELVVRGPHVMSGYWRREDETAARFPRRDGLFPQLRTGDYGRLDADGFLYFEGRRDDQYKAHGFRVSTVEVEAAACRVPGVSRAAVLPPSDRRPGPVLVVSAELTAEQVLHGLREQLEDFKVPDLCLVVPQLPTNGNGKVDKRALAGVADGC